MSSAFLLPLYHLEYFLIRSPIAFWAAPLASVSIAAMSSADSTGAWNAALFATLAARAAAC